jgi:segregation and condensation protein B
VKGGAGTAAGETVDEQLSLAVEAVIFAAGEPVSPRELAEAFDDADAADVERAIDAMEARFRDSGSALRVERIAGGVRLATRPELGEWVRRFFRQRNRTRLTPAALETLAIVAYRQPVTAPEIQAIRGKDPSAALKSLIDKKLVRILGKKKVVGSPLLYGTSKQFLVHFGLDRIGDLPSITDFDELLGAAGTDAASLLEAASAAAGEPGEPGAAEEAEIEVVDEAEDGAAADADPLHEPPERGLEH